MAASITVSPHRDPIRRCAPNPRLPVREVCREFVAARGSALEPGFRSVVVPITGLAAVVWAADVPASDLSAAGVPADD